MRRVLISLGSNVGERARQLNRAATGLRAAGLQKLRTSSLFETAPQYVKDQPRFLNAVCSAYTSMAPRDLLRITQALERELGREPSVRNGPRAIDIDLLAYEGHHEDSADLTLPHPRMHERAFVMTPLEELDSAVQAAAAEWGAAPAPLSAEAATDSSMAKVHALGTGDAVACLQRRTRVMGILNCTADSFSDGGKWATNDSLLSHVREMCAAGVDIIDVGGESTRPGAEPVLGQDETQRVLNAIHLIRSCDDARVASIPLSVDTYRASTARAAVEAGATMINDVSGGRADPEMFGTVAALGVPYILMHSRGDAQTMQSPDHTSYPNGVVDTVRAELAGRVELAEEAGVCRWNIIVDPGIGFAKLIQHNIDLLRRLPDTVPAGLPVLLGASRKGFIGTILAAEDPDAPGQAVHTTASDPLRGWGTAATTCAAVQHHAAIVRVHDVAETVAVCRVAHALWRGWGDAKP